VVAIFASAGCGKTALLNAIYKIYRKYDVMGVALSGKAAVRISEATGIAAQTIHRTLGYQFGQFEHNEKFPLLHEIIAIDESTMNNGDLFYALLRAIPSGSKVIMLGDVKQITPIGNCQVFADIIRSNVIPKFELTKLHRQAQLSGIIPTSLQVANQDQIFDSNFEGNIILGELQDMELDIYKQDDNAPDRVIKHFLKHYNDIKNLMEVQIVTALRIKGDLSNYNLNNKIQEIINPIAEDDVYVEVKLSDSNKDEPKIYKIKLGDKVINTKNNYKTLDTYGNTTPIFNGNMGIVTEIDYKSCVVNFIGIGDIILGRKEIINLELA
jgi:exodeoxyribonuclease V alpha subunit